MTQRIGRLTVGLLAVAVVAFLTPGWAQEHPEHPKKKEEHPKSAGAGVTMEQLSEAMEAYIHDQEKKGGGAWKLEDPEAKTALELTLVRVHKDKLARTAVDTYFACVDVQGSDGHLYDVDVFMKGPDKDHLEVTEVSVHKKDGKERYTWKEEGGVWKKAAVGGHEHPKEHPKGGEHPRN